MNEITNIILNDDGNNGNKEKAINMMLNEAICRGNFKKYKEHETTEEEYTKINYETRPPSIISINNSGNVEIFKSTYNLLETHLTITEVSKKLEESLWEEIGSDKKLYHVNIVDWFENVKKYGIPYCDDEGVNHVLYLVENDSLYTYNIPNMLDINIICFMFKEVNSDKSFVILEIDNDSDLGYDFSSPHIFAFDECNDEYDMLWSIKNYSLALYFGNQHIYYSIQNGGNHYEPSGWSEDLSDEFVWGKMGNNIIEKIWGDEDKFDIDNVNIKESVINKLEKEFILKSFNNYVCDVKYIAIVGDLNSGEITVKQKEN